MASLFHESVRRESDILYLFEPKNGQAFRGKSPTASSSSTEPTQIDSDLPIFAEPTSSEFSFESRAVTGQIEELNSAHVESPARLKSPSPRLTRKPDVPAHNKVGELEPLPLPSPPVEHHGDLTKSGLVGATTRYTALLFGPTGSGKSSLIRAISGRDVEIGHNISSCTAECTSYTFQDGEKIWTLVDTPGFDDSSMDDLEILRKIIEYCSGPLAGKIDCVLYLHRITDQKFSGKDMVRLRLLQALCGQEFYPHITIVTTMWNKIPNTEVEEQCKQRLGQLMASPRHWNEILGGLKNPTVNHFAFMGNPESGLDILRHVSKIGHPGQPPRFIQEIHRGQLLEQTEAVAILLRERRKREDKMRQEMEEEAQEMEAEKREAAELRYMQNRPQSKTTDNVFLKPSRSNTFPSGESRPSSFDLGYRRGSVATKQSASGKDDRHNEYDRREKHRSRDDKSSRGFSAMGYNININISKQR